MKVPYSWLAEWVKVPWPAPELGSRLTMAGIELEALGAAAPPFTGVVVAQIVSTEPHPQADKLQVCRVSTGSGAPLQIVCGAGNARAGLRSALALVGAQLPGDLTIKAAKLRGVESQGMLASAKELGLADASAGILELPQDAPLGRALREYLALDEPVLDLNVTPNRGDAMSVIGIAREVAALAGTKVSGPAIGSVPAGHADRLAVHLEAPAACPRFAGCILRGVNNRAEAPLWMRERLRRAGVRAISPVVDVTNYVMLELGQPMHAYDLKKLRGDIRVRLARSAEPVTLLDGNTVSAAADVLLITDGDGAVGLAGIMGGLRTAVSEETTEVFLESAYFAPDGILGRARRLGLQTDASQRFERGVDPTQQSRAIERALALLTPVAGGTAGPVEVTQSAPHLPRRPAVPLRAKQLTRLLGVELPAERIEATLAGLQMQVTRSAGGWQVTPPAHRFDIEIEADLIEEVARVVGFEAIPESAARVPQGFRSLPEEHPPEAAVLGMLAARGYEEAITLAFVDPQLQERLFPGRVALALSNPIASDLSVMRVSLWPGLLRAALENQRRQADRTRLFEHGTRFEVGGGTREIDTLAGLACGARLPEQWGVPKEMRAAADFYDVKGDLAALFAATGAPQSFRFEPGSQPALHPGRTARVLRCGQEVGWLGELHPTLVQALDFTDPPILFELDFDAALAVKSSTYEEISRFPQVRRDLAIVVDESVTLSTLAERVTLAASSLLRDLRIFDVYRGPGLEKGRKSVALGLIFQAISRTLTDDDVERLVGSVIADLRENLNARIRE
ncbi:MAG: phenylalanine--tRNA ligase subunit beta [Gammaproteobacteria bacterium]|nr:MAG: phenylalanine--tRNA ligase subunit beta [Gammaproteobacteria bacterium]